MRANFKAGMWIVASCFLFSAMNAMAKVLLVIGDAAEVLDTFYPLFRIKEEGHEVHVAAPAKRVYHLVLHDSAGLEVNRNEGFGFVGGATITSEEGYLTTKFFRALGCVYLEQQARV